MKDKVFTYMNTNHMIAAGDEVVVGVSGGADSVCLLFLLHQFRSETPFSLTCVHVNHKIREDAAQDAEYVRTLCEKWQIPYVLVEKNVQELARELKLSEEEAGRMARYEAFNAAFSIPKGEHRKICVAHTMDDNAETILFHLFRGCGVSGLCGIRAVRDEVIRPLLCVNRTEIETYLKQNQIHFCMDSTNAGDDYTRNRIRHHILPYAEREVHANVIARINETARQLEETELFLQELTETAYLKWVSETGDGVDIAEGLVAEENRVIYSRVLYRALQKTAGCRKDLSAVHIRELEGLFSKSVSKQLSLPYCITATREYYGVRLSKASPNKNKGMNEELLILRSVFGEESVTVIPDGGRMITTLFAVEKMPEIEQKMYTKWLDYGKINQPPVIRTCRPGDYLTVTDDGRKQNFNRYCINQKIPAKERDNMYLIADGSHIIWIPGYRISAYYKVNEQTKIIMEIRWDGGNV